MTTEEKLRLQLEVCGIDKYHNKGYTGKGITILCHENTDHAREAMRILQSVAPDASIIYASVTQKITGGKLKTYAWNIDGKIYSFDEVMKIFKPDVISCSLRSVQECKEREDIVQPYIDDGSLIIVGCAGNEGVSPGAQPMYGNGLVIGAVEFSNNGTNIKLTTYSGRTKDSLDVDYVGFMWDWSGTSAATPFVAGQIALFMSRYGKMSQSRFQEVIKPYCKDLGDKDKDWKYGDGLIVLPDEDINLKGDDDMFKDVEPNRWSAKYIEWASDKGIIEGFEDGTFRPTGFLTREQGCALLKRLYDLIKEEDK